MIFKDLGRGIMTFTLRNRFVYAVLAMFVITMIAGRQWMATAQTTDDLTPGMLFGPLYVSDGQHIELCASYLSPTGIKATVHFRNLAFKSHMSAACSKPAT